MLKFLNNIVYINIFLYLCQKFCNMGTVLYVLIAYLVGVTIYTIVTKNDAMHKHDPHVKISGIIKEGLRKMGIGFLIAGAIIAVIVFLLKWFN
jgi:hypothetical protein